MCELSYLGSLMLSSIAQGSLSLFPAISSALLQWFRAAQLSWWSNVLLLVSATATSVLLLRSSWEKKSFSPLLACWGDATCSSQVCLGKVTILCECRAAGGETPALGRLCLKHWFAQSCWEAAATLVTTDLAKLFVSPSLSFYTTIRAGISPHQCMYSCFHHSALKKMSGIGNQGFAGSALLLYVDQGLCHRRFAGFLWYYFLLFTCE